MAYSDAVPVVDVVNGNNGGNNLFGGDGWWAIIIFALIFGWGRGGYGGFGGFGGGNDGGTAAGYTLASDFATIQRQLSDGFNSIDNALDRQNAGICDLGYTQLNLTNGINTAIMQGNNALQAQIADCCCKTQQNIKDGITQGVMNTNLITGAIKDCCCDNEKATMQTRFDAAQYNCNTLAAIDKVGDRIIDYLAADKAQTLRDENQALRLAASQAAQNNYLINQLRPCPIPAYPSCNPWASVYGGGNSCGCA